MFSDSVLEKLWDSYLIETPVPCDGERGELIRRFGECEDRLRPNLSREQILALEDYDRASDAIHSLDEKHAFLTGVRFAVRFILEAAAE